MELVTVITRDFLRLHGIYSPTVHARRTARSKGSVDAAILAHGIGGNFYSSRLLSHLSELLGQLGISTVVVNTRGHDMVNTVSWRGQARTVGAAFEDVDHCRYDLAAWHDFLIDRGCDNILYLGHSLGAIKSLYSAAKEPPSNLRSVIALSPSRLSFQRMLITSQDGLFQETFQRCQQLVDEGLANEPVIVKFPVTTWMTPQCYLDKYGPQEKYNWLNFVDQVQIPALLLFGERELASHAAFIGLEQEIEPLKQKNASLQIRTIADADHFYTSKFDLVDDAISRWLTNEM